MEKGLRISTISVYSGFAWEATLIKYMLEDEGIKVYLKDENISSVTSKDVSPGTWDTVTLLVAKENKEKARTLIASYEKKYQHDV